MILIIQVCPCIQLEEEELSYMLLTFTANEAAVDLKLNTNE